MVSLASPMSRRPLGEEMFVAGFVVDEHDLAGAEFEEDGSGAFEEVGRAVEGRRELR